jgi:hypothetical protein
VACHANAAVEADDESAVNPKQRTPTTTQPLATTVIGADYPLAREKRPEAMNVHRQGGSRGPGGHTPVGRKSHRQDTYTDQYTNIHLEATKLDRLIVGSFDYLPAGRGWPFVVWLTPMALCSHAYYR